MKVTLLLAAALAPFLVLAQDPDPAKLLELSSPGPMHKIIGKMAGDWTVDVWYKIGTIEGTSKAECHADWILDGHYLAKTYTSEMAGKPFTVQQTVGYDNFSKEFFEWQIESDNTSRLETKGQLGADGKSISCTGPTIDPATMKKATIRTLTTFVDDDTYTIDWYMKVGDQPETKQVTLTHKRKKTS